MKKLLKNHKGVTMMEVMVTIAILGIVVVPCLSSFVIAQRGNVLAKQTYGEYTLATNLMEELKAADDVEAMLDAVKADRDDGIDVVYTYNDAGYHEVTILVGEPEEGQEHSAGKIILKGVIAP